MNIIISYTSVYPSHLKDSIYLGRGKNNPFPLLSNNWSHKSGTKATYQVSSIEQAVFCFKDNLFRCTKEDKEGYREQLRGLYELSLLKNKEYGRVVYLCWCKDEFNPKSWHHSCHCEVLRDVILTKHKSN